MHLIQTEPFDPTVALQQFNLQNGQNGALIQFFGVVRGDGDLDALELEHYPAMTKTALDTLEAEAKARWAINDILIIHRIGKLHLGELIMMVAVCAPHRADAFSAADFLMDHLKSRVPFWKREYRGAKCAWVSANSSDEAALTRW